MKQFFTIIFLGTVLLGGCNIINPAEPVPTFVHVDSFRFAGDTKLYGSSSHNINTIFATYNGIEIGVFDLPCNIPVIAVPGGQLILQPGIAVNGFNDQESPYPFYTQDIDTLVPQPGKIVYYTPVTGYIADTKIAFIENFDMGSTTFTQGDGSAIFSVPTTLTNPSLVFEGHGSGYMNLPSYDDSGSQYFSISQIPIAQNTPVLCELNYKSNVSIAIGLFPLSTNGVTNTTTTEPQYNNLAFSPSPNGWTKIYINLAELVSIYPADYYQIVLKAQILDSTQKTGYALFDNIKVVTQK